MGVDCCIYLPSDARLRDIATVMGIASGAVPEKHILDNTDGAWSCHIPKEAVEIQAPDCEILVMCPNLFIRIPTPDGEKNHHVMFHSEASGTHGLYNLLMPRSTPFWIAMGLKLVKFFGGWIDYNDCDSEGKDVEFKKPREWNDPEDNKEWADFQQDLMEVTPLTRKDLEDVRHLASYDVGFEGVPVPDKKAAKPKKQSRKEKDEAVAAAVVNQMFKDAED